MSKLFLSGGVLIVCLLNGLMSFAAAPEETQPDHRALAALSEQISDLEHEMSLLQAAVGLEERGYFTSDEHDQIEGLLFQYLCCRSALGDIAERHLNPDGPAGGDDEELKRFVVGFNASVQVAYSTSRLVATFLREPAVIKKLNERFYRSGIEKGTYDSLFLEVTDTENIQAMAAAWQHFRRELNRSGSRLAVLCETDGQFKNWVRQIVDLHSRTDLQVRYILREKSMVLPALRNYLRQSEAAKLAREGREVLSENLYLARGILFENVSRLKSPMSQILSFSDAQVRQIERKLEPGDLVFTYTDGYMSNIFLPGAFKHGIIYVGPPEKRQIQVPGDGALFPVPGERAAEIERLIEVAEDRGRRADVIEAVAEGVIFNSLEHLLHTHINRLVVLRPKLSEQEKNEALFTAFSLLGNGYDFKFDFTDASFHCCTEVIYRALHGRGSHKFELTKRAGKQTLSADDIINTYLDGKKASYEVVLLAVESSRKEHRARLLTGAAAEKELRKLMKLGD